MITVTGDTDEDMQIIIILIIITAHTAPSIVLNVSVHTKNIDTSV